MPPTSEAMAWATKAWTTQLGEANVLLERARIRPAQRATYPTRSKTIAVLRPANDAQVAACLRIAAAHGVPVKPVSGGARWGLGSRVGAAPYMALLDLSRMDALVEVDTTLGTVTVEPGVSVAMVREQLSGTPWHLPGPSSTPYASVLGNAVDGGVCDGMVPLRRRDVLALTAVLASGEVVHTAASAWLDARVRGRGLGIDWTALFLQTNLGVVTRMTLALTRRPPNHAAVHLGLGDGELATAVDQVRELLFDGLVTGSVALHSTERVVADSVPFPYDETGGATPVPSAWLDGLRAALGGHDWYGEALTSAATPQHLDAAMAAVHARLAPHLARVDVHRGGASAHVHAGVGTSVQTAYWRHRTPVEAPDRHPDRDGVGFIVFAPVLPLVGTAVVEAVQATGEVLARYGFERLLTIRTLDPRTAVLWTAIAFDRSTEDDAAMACHDALRALAASQGWVVPRPGQRGWDAHHRVAPGAIAFARQLKSLLDPSDILAPGEGDFRPFWRD